jgi:hypothetical protein
MPPVISVLLVCIGTLFRSRAALCLENLLQGSTSTFFLHKVPQLFALKEGMWDTQIAALRSSPTVTHDPRLSTAYENSPVIFSRVSPRFSDAYGLLPCDKSRYRYKLSGCSMEVLTGPSRDAPGE